MTSVLRQFRGDAIISQVEICPSLWDLDRQIAKCKEWLIKNTSVLGSEGLVLDIGFQARSAVVPGYTIPCEFMKLLCARDIDLWISLYPGECDDQAE